MLTRVNHSIQRLLTRRARQCVASVCHKLNGDHDTNPATVLSLGKLHTISSDLTCNNSISSVSLGSRSMNSPLRPFTTRIRQTDRLARCVASALPVKSFIPVRSLSSSTASAVGAEQSVTRLDEYLPPAHLIPNVDLHMQFLDNGVCHVRNSMVIEPNMDGAITSTARRTIILQGDSSMLHIHVVMINGKNMTVVRTGQQNTAANNEEHRENENERFVYVSDSEMRIELQDNELDGPIQLDIHTSLQPAENKALEGLYRSKSMYVTQCEAEGFRRITYFSDRPDVMSSYSVTLEANKATCPVLLSNGDCVMHRDLPNGRHVSTWIDPHKKPCYLFALVAGDLEFIEDKITTMSGNDVTLRIFTEKHNIDRCDHAMESLKKSFTWDEQTYGREYDLDIFNIVAVDDFNMGAMENKSLNIFNSAYVLADPSTATDTDYHNIEAVVGHEYFHNWSGNRVTCRDWFQLSLKEGLTVFRDQEFSADMGHRGFNRIGSVQRLRAAQFAEDSGPTSHPVRPSEYVQINNFYTATVYEKGAELVRMIHTLLGAERYRKGTDLYFERHDGQAVTVEHFVKCMEDANDGVDLAPFMPWYFQNGTPNLHVDTVHDAGAQTLTVNIRQAAPANNPNFKPVLMPVRFSLIGSNGSPVPLQSTDENVTNHTVGNDNDEVTLLSSQAEQSFVLDGVSSADAVPSILRGFSAPVKLHTQLTADQLGFLAENDTDAFNRWESAQELALRVLIDSTQQRHKARNVDDGTADVVSTHAESNHTQQILVDRFANLINSGADPLLDSISLALPSPSYLMDVMPAPLHPQDVHAASVALRSQIADASSIAGRYEHWYAQAASRAVDANGQYDPEGVGIRGLCNILLHYMVNGNSKTSATIGPQFAHTQFQQAKNMTERLGGLVALVHSNDADRASDALATFFELHKDNDLVLNKWFAVQASSQRPDTLERVQELMQHPAFDIKNPNRCYSLLFTLLANPNSFHRNDGAGYRFAADMILELDSFNPQVAARMANCFRTWRRLDSHLQQHIHGELNRILAAELSTNTREIVEKIAQAPSLPL
jgi:aminopeptidase N